MRPDELKLTAAAAPEAVEEEGMAAAAASGLLQFLVQCLRVARYLAQPCGETLLN